MRSLQQRSTETPAIDDRTTKARIRDAAITCFAEYGVAATTARKVATEAEVSPGLVMHHFGSMEGLRSACDEYVAALIRETKSNTMAAGPGFDPLAALRAAADGPPITRYLARTLAEGSPQVVDLVDELVNDAVGYIETGVEAGLITPSDFPRERATILTLWSLGGIVLHQHLERLLGVDITGDYSQDPKAATAYIAPVLEILSGFITDTTKKLMNEAFVESTEGAT